MKIPNDILCTIFKGSREQEMYVYVPKASGTENIPEALIARMGKMQAVMTLRITPDKKLARANAYNVLREINDKGYYLQLPPEITGQVLEDGD